MIIADTGFWLALFGKRDPYHSQACHAAARHEPEGFITTQAVIGESCYMLSRWHPLDAVTGMLETIVEQEVQIFDPPLTALQRCAMLMQKYRDLPMDYADATLVLLAEQLGHGRILTTDQRDFGTYRWKNHYPFENLLEAEET